ncbi:hypothetical protein KSF78_0003233 [Schistosoma japonicum]|uniref:Calcium-binding EF-hand,domain-containing protein n=1 Tax=Schistosoma japonicum TaxID=6182 RepID=Q5BQX8_SCHJA|nr:SJCHGC09767 protein [Schistosoma japonicum]KAH8865638.1 hypothetical protein KSF78_0003233 [Schistosoma japonicum]KAH8865640.1 hypothetical protein KSF78_0003233 [Schistosoma japonicum]KAH8865641.1 hypothetical protein KSF78_0003233 [Schistosoma japonicum]KAH8865644.1 hypothetical protein KSF78_0003233 [Schistosoma japonicum]
MEEVEVKEMFCMIDRKQRGKINHRQLRAFLKKHDAKFSRKSVKNYIKSIDSDGDGKVTLDDLTRALTKTEHPK